MAGLKRPVSVLVISIILLAFNGLALVSTPLMAAVPAVQEAWEKMGVSVAMAVASTVVFCGAVVIACIGMLMGKNWGRLLYLVSVPIGFVIGLIIFGFQPMTIPSLILYVVFLILLTRPKVNDYFAGVAPQEPVPPPIPQTPEAPPVPESTEPPETPEE